MELQKWTFDAPGFDVCPYDKYNFRISMIEIILAQSIL